MMKPLACLAAATASAALLLTATAAFAQQTPLITQDLPPIPGDLQVQMTRIVLAPAGERPTTTAGQAGHAHPGATYAYVLKGEVNNRLGTGPETRFKAGEVWSEKPGEAHYIANASKTETAEILVVFVLPKGVPVSGPVR